MALCLGLGTGAVFKLVPAWFPDKVGAVTGVVGAAGGLGGFFPPIVMGLVKSADRRLRPRLHPDGGGRVARVPRPGRQREGRSPGAGRRRTGAQARRVVGSAHDHHPHRTRRGQGGRRPGARRERLVRGHAGDDRPVRRGDRRPPVDPHRSREGGADAVRRHDRARPLHALARPEVLLRDHGHAGLRLRRQLRLRQGALPGAAAGRPEGAHARRADERRRRPRRHPDHRDADLRGRGRREAGVRGRSRSRGCSPDGPLADGRRSRPMQLASAVTTGPD